MAYYKGTSGTFYVETRSLETGLPVTVEASTVSMAVYKETGTPVSWESGVDYEITSITGGLMVYVENFGRQNSISFFFSCTDSSVYIPMVCIALEEYLVGILSQILTTVDNTAKAEDIPTPAVIADAVLTTEFSQYTLKAESGTYSTIPLNAQFSLALAAQGMMNGGLLTKRTVDSITDLTSLSKYARVEIAAPSDIESSKDEIITTCATASGFATPADVQLTTTTEKVEVISQSVDLTGIAKIDDIETAKNAVISACKTATGFSTQQDVKDAQEAILEQSGRVDVEEVAQAVWEYGGTPEERTVKATGIEIGGDVSVDVDPDKIAEAVWTADNRTLTGYTPIAPDDISGSSYCTRADVERRWGVMNVRMWANLDNDNDEYKIQAQIDWAILSATSRIESDFASYIYKLPFNPVPLEVRRHASALAGVELFNCRAMAATNDSPTIQRAENEYFEWKTKIFSGIEIVGAERKE